jgi:hypothetical protein
VLSALGNDPVQLPRVGHPPTAQHQP